MLRYQRGRHACLVMDSWYHSLIRAKAFRMVRLTRANAASLGMRGSRPSPNPQTLTIPLVGTYWAWLWRHSLASKATVSAMSASVASISLYMFFHPHVHLPTLTRLRATTSPVTGSVVTGRMYTTRTAFGAGEAFRATWGALCPFLRAAPRPVKNH